MPIVTAAMNPPIQANLRPMKSRKAPMVPSRLREPSSDSDISNGTAQTRLARTRAMMNVPPPPAPTSRGNLQMLPVPTAIPMAAATNAKRLENTSGFARVLSRVMIDPISCSSSGQRTCQVQLELGHLPRGEAGSSGTLTTCAEAGTGGAASVGADPSVVPGRGAAPGSVFHASIPTGEGARPRPGRGPGSRTGNDEPEGDRC